MKRESGYYFVSINGILWRVAHWLQHEQSWYITGSELKWVDSEFRAIDENQLKRSEDEKVQTKTSVEMLYDLKGVEVPNLIEPMSSEFVESILNKINKTK